LDLIDFSEPNKAPNRQSIGSYDRLLGVRSGEGHHFGEVVRVALSDFSQTHRLPVSSLEGSPGHRRLSHTGVRWSPLPVCPLRKEHFVPNSCGNRHCPSCQKLNSANWLEQQVDHLLPIPYFHDVFTLPHEFNPLIQYNQQQLYSLLFSSATATLLQFGRNNLKATLGITAVLHTWSQNMLDHYHLHCVVTGGGLSLDGKSWVSLSPEWQFPVKALSIVFRAKFRDGLMNLFEKGQLQFPISESGLSDPIRFTRWLRGICRRKWVVYTSGLLPVHKRSWRICVATLTGSPSPTADSKH